MSTLLLRRLAGGGAAAAAAAAYTWNEYVEWAALRDDAAEAERHLPPTWVAQRSKVVPVPSALSPADIDRLLAWHDANERRFGSSGRTEGNGSAAYKTGAWETSFLHTDGAFAEALPDVLDRLRRHAVAADARSGSPLLDAHGGPIAAADLRPRTVEHHVVRPGGSLPYLSGVFF